MGFIDLRMLLKWYAKAISKHIEFSKGYLFLTDKVKSATFQKERMQFTYDLKSMKIDLSQARQNIMNKLKSKEGKLRVQAWWINYKYSSQYMSER